jgi:hypothetical protein
VSDPSRHGGPPGSAGSELSRLWPTLPARKRLDALIDQTDARRAVRATPIAPLYYTLREVGLADSTEIVQLASPEQFRGFIDLGGWKRDRVVPHDVLTWLRAARGDDTTEFLDKLHGIDLEVLELLLRHYVSVHDLEEDPDVHPAGLTLETPEGKYLLEIHAEGVDAPALRQILQDLIGENPFESVRLIEAIRWEIPSELEETAYQFRSGRLNDLGFPSLDDAAALFSRVDLAEPPPGSSALVAERRTIDFVSAALDGLSDLERGNAEEEVVGLANAVLVAEVADPGDLESVRRAQEMARDYLNLGFERLTGGDPVRAPELLRETPLRRIFQVGFTLTLRLKYRADRLAKDPSARAGGIPLVLDDEWAALSALRRKRPLRALRTPGAEPVSFRSGRELAESDAVVARAETQVPILRAALGGTDAAIGEAVQRCLDPSLPTTAERLLAAAVAWSLLGEPRVAPIPGAKLSDLAARITEGTAEAPRVKAAAAEAAAAALGARLSEAEHGPLRSMIERVLGRLVSEVGGSYLRDGTVRPESVMELPLQV